PTSPYSVYVTGTSNDTSNAVVTKLAPAGQGLTSAWTKGFHPRPTGTSHAYGITADGSGNIYTTGSFSGSVDFDPSGGKGHGKYALTSTGYPDIYVSKLDPNGNFAAATHVGGNVGGTHASDRGVGITLDGAGNVYTTGEFTATTDFDPTAGTYYL